MRELIGMCLLILLVACAKQGEANQSTTNPEVPVTKMFTHEGCTMYRFEDSGRYRYFARCDGARSTTSWAESCGNNCTHDVSIDTEFGR